MNKLLEQGTNEWILCLLITIMHEGDVRAIRPSFFQN